MNGVNKAKRAAAAGVLVLVGFGGGATAMVVTSASADEQSSSRASGHEDEEALTGDTLEGVTAAVEAEFPGATIERTETDSDGVYEAHIVTADDEELTVELDEEFTVTGTEDGHCDRGGHGEEALTGDALEGVTAAVEAEYPGATIERTETDSDGVYEAHIVTADDEELTVELDEEFAITGTEARR